MAQKKVVIVLPYRGFDGDTYRAVRQALERRGHQVVTAGLFPGTAEATDGSSVPVMLRLREIKTYQYDGYVFLGGEGMRSMLDDRDARKLAKDISYKAIGATGEGVALLALADALKKKRVTAPTDWADLLRRRGVQFTGRPLEVDDKLVTAQNGEVAEQFANAIAAAVGN
ncbi:MAG: DJ-1/PfpI family protein [Anaerolineae bacterium]|jgi:putative intracellular protease/amidase